MMASPVSVLRVGPIVYGLFLDAYNAYRNVAKSFPCRCIHRVWASTNKKLSAAVIRNAIRLDMKTK